LAIGEGITSIACSALKITSEYSVELARLAVVGALHAKPVAGEGGWWAGYIIGYLHVTQESVRSRSKNLPVWLQ